MKLFFTFSSGTIPASYGQSKQKPQILPIDESVAAASLARNVVCKTMARIFIFSSINHATAHYANNVCKSGDNILIYRTKFKHSRIWKRKDPFSTDEMDENAQTVYSRDDVNFTIWPSTFFISIRTTHG